ncbi:class I SAM-dependent methyltransferase [Acetobacter orientalis]|uniref:class I SAM-dependent methyltransferase n=1 Tax=Acetobacter orientalis TaxID=146474 RepID=UPI0039E8DE6B
MNSFNNKGGVLTQSYSYTNDWFVGHQPVWATLLRETKPKKILEIGSYEGRSSCFIIDHAGQNQDIELHCIDTWCGGIEHKNLQINMSEVENRFDQNTKLSIKNSPNNIYLHKYKGLSGVFLPKILTEVSQGYFDLIYIDGSHQAPDVIYDAVLSFKLLRKGGVLIFDDYLWSEGVEGGNNLLRCPKIAIDAFTNIYSQKVKILSAPLYQMYIIKIDD